MIKIAIIYHSGRGHTKRLAEAVFEGCNQVDDTETKLFNVEEVENEWDYLNEADAIIFGSPTYMGMISADFKKFMDKTSKIWLKQSWKDKLAAGFVNSGWPSGDKLNTLEQLMIFACQHSMIWVSTGLIPGDLSNDPEKQDINRLGSFIGVMSVSPFKEDATTAPPECDLKTGRLLGARVAEIAHRHKKV